MNSFFVRAVRAVRAGVTLAFALGVALVVRVLPAAILAGLGVAAVLALLLWLLALLLRLRGSKQEDWPCAEIPQRFWRRPDPYIYDQSYLAGLGIEVTWDNPDIWFELGGTRISDNLLPGTDYEIVVSAHNGSVEAPAFNTIVEFYSRDYGAGAIPNYLGASSLPMIPVQGFGPAICRFPWTTPAGGGHFCIQVRLLAVDDSNPLNNEGQKNVRVVHPAGGGGILILPLFNASREPIRLTVIPAAYSLSLETEATPQPATMRTSRLTAIRQVRTDDRTEPIRDSEVRRTLMERQLAVIDANRRGGFPLSSDWKLALPSEPLTIAPGETKAFSTTIGIPPGTPSGTYPVTLNAYRDDGTLYGGVTELLRIPGATQMEVATAGSPVVIYPGTPHGGATVPGHRGDIQRTGCIQPSERDRTFGAGQGAALERAAIWLVAGLVAQALLSGAAGTAMDIILGLAGVNSYVNWWLNRRLLCLGDACAIGIVWSVEPPGDKPALSFDRFDDDYSINVLLSPASPGDLPSAFATQAHLVRPHPSIVAENLPTFGVDRVATQANIDGKPAPVIVSRALQDDPTNEVNAQLSHSPVARTSWLDFGLGATAPTDAPDLWSGQEGGNTSAISQLPLLPNTQLIHCEFEGTAISNIQPVLLVAGALAGTILVTNSGTIAAGGAVAVAAAAAWFLLLLFLLAVFTYLVSGHGDPEDAGLPAASITTVAAEDGTTPSGAWDARFTLVAIRGRFVYDYGHSRGWNEIHPARTISKITDDAFESLLLAHGLPPVRPRTDAEVAPLVLKYCEDIWPSADSGNRTISAVHPSLAGSQVRLTGSHPTTAT
jgi:hypothetical protein